MPLMKKSTPRPRAALLVNRACRGREHVIGVASDQSDSPDDQDQDHRQHHRVFGNVLTLFLRPDSPAKFSHNPPPLLTPVP